MTGVLLLSKDGYYADRSGGVAWGPSSDKAWLRSIITNEIVLVGHRTFETIRDYESIVCLPRLWLVDTTDKIYGITNAMGYSKDNTEPFVGKIPEINFGGIKTLMKHKPDKLIIHETFENLGSGLRVPVELLKDYEFYSSTMEPEYRELIYVKKK